MQLLGCGRLFGFVPGKLTWKSTKPQIVYITDIALAIRGVSVGIGSKNDHLNAWMQAEAEKYYIIWITLCK